MSAEAIRISAGLFLSIALLVVWPLFVKLNPFFSLLFAAILFALIAGVPLPVAINAMQSGFGSLLQQIGIIVALGSVLGTLLEKTGAMEVISASLLRLFGVRRPLLAMTVVGLLVGIPVFCDSGFIIVSKLLPSLALKTSTSQTSLTLALSSSLYTTHTLVPPTPGPLAAAANLGLANQLGPVILIGLISSIPVSIVTYFYAKRFGIVVSGSLSHKITATGQYRVNPVMAFLPLVLPILLITVASFGKIISEENLIIDIFSFLGIPMIAMLIGVLLAFLLIDRNISPDWSSWTTDGLKSAGIILLIVGAGGSFGAVIRASNLTAIVNHLAADEQLSGVLFLSFAWMIGALFKVAQGSTTSSMIITSSLMAPLAAAAGLHSATDLCVLVLSIGGGAMTVSHANDAYFWVVSEFGGISETNLFRVFTPMTLIQGLTTYVTAIILFLLL